MTDTPPPPIFQRPSRHRRWAVWAAVGVLICAAIGTGVVLATRTTSDAAHGSPLNTPPPAGTSSYIAGGNGFVVFLQWRQDTGHIAGTAQVAAATGVAPGEQVSSDSIPFTGTLNGSSITLSFDGDPTQFGIITDGSFTLDVPQQGGGFTVAHFLVANPGAYNRAVASLHGSVNSANQLAEEQQATRNEQQTFSRDVNTVDNDLSSLTSASSQTTSDAQSLQSDLQTLESDVATAQSDLQQTLSAAAQGGSTSSSSVCADADTVGADADTVAADAGSLQADIQSSVSIDLGAISSSISTLNSDYSTLQAAESRLPSAEWPTTQLPTQGQVSQAISQANSTATQAVATTNGYISQANSGVTTAYGYASQAAQAGSCGTAPSPPSPLQPISP